MSSSLPDAENAAGSTSLRLSEQGRNVGKDGEQKDNKPLRWTPPPRSKSSSLLTQALATNYEIDESSADVDTLTAPSTSSQDHMHSNLHSGQSVAQEDESRNAYKTAKATDSPPDQTSMTSTHTSLEIRSFEDAPQFLSSGSRIRGTSLERTNKEKREPSGGPMLTNPGDTGLSGHTTPSSPATPDLILADPPTDGARARYRSWRDPRPKAAERAWSIGQDGSDDSGHIENSVKEALAGVEPNSRSRKSSHSLRFFKEGLPEDKFKRRENKSRPKDGIAGPSTSPLERPVLPPAQNGQPSRNGYFDIPSDVEHISKDQLKMFPPQLLADIRKNHNLTPGASKGTSFSRSIPVTASEKLMSDETANPTVPTNQTRVESPVPMDAEEDSGEEQISSAFFVPHKTPHDSPRIERGQPEATRAPLHQLDSCDETDSQQWLEEHAVPSREVDEKYLGDVRPILSPTPIKLPEAAVIDRVLHDDTIPLNRNGIRENKVEYMEKATHDDRVSNDDGYSIRGDESGQTDVQDSDTTPTGSFKRDSLAPREPPRLHDHQEQRPVEAIELIPYRHQVGGHTTMWRFSKRAVCKQLNNRENEFYEKVERYHPQLLKFLPRYIGVLNVNFEKQRRKPTKKDETDDKDSQSTKPAGNDGNLKLRPEGLLNNDTEQKCDKARVISQSLDPSSAPVPMVTFADNRHIVPRSFLGSGWRPGELQYRSKSDNGIVAHRVANQAQPPLPDGEFTFRKDGPKMDAEPREATKRPTLEDKHSDSWGSTIKNKELRNKVFDEAFLRQPIPIHHHRKPASQRRGLPNRNGTVLRTSNSESSLKVSQQTVANTPTQPAEESMRRRAIKTAAEQRKLSLTPVTEKSHAKTEIIGGDRAEGESESDDKTGTSAPEPELSHNGKPVKNKRQRRYSSGGLRRKPAEGADDRGSLKYFEEADDAGYKGDVEEEMFAMDPEPSNNSSATVASQALSDPNSVATASTHLETEKDISSGTMLPAAPNEPDVNISIPRPVNPKEAQTQQDSRVEFFLLLEDLTAGMKKPCIMDLKMGTRQYGVEANEKKQKSQRQKCAATTSKELGVRVCGLQVWDVKSQKYIFQDKYYGRDLKVGSQFQGALQRFLYDGIDHSSVLRHIPTILRKLAELEVLIRTLVGYRFYAASLLMFYDGDSAEEGESDSTATEKDTGSRRKEIDFKIADFANCVVKEDVHRTRPPCPPRHPDLPDIGFLRGLKSLRRYFLAIQQDLERKDMGYSSDDKKAKWQGATLDGAEENDDEGNMSY